MRSKIYAMRFEPVATSNFIDGRVTLQPYKVITSECTKVTFYVHVCHIVKSGRSKLSSGCCYFKDIHKNR